MIHLSIPIHLRLLAHIPGELRLDPTSPITIDSILDALEAQYPALTGTIRDHSTKKRRPMIRFYALNEDLSHDPTDRPLPEKITSGAQPLYIIGAIAGG